MGDTVLHSSLATSQDPVMLRMPLHCLQNSLAQKGYLINPCNVLQHASCVQPQSFDDIRMCRQPTQQPSYPLPQCHSLGATGWPTTCFFTIVVKIVVTTSTCDLTAKSAALTLECLWHVLGANNTAHGSKPSSGPLLAGYRPYVGLRGLNQQPTVDWNAGAPSDAACSRWCDIPRHPGELPHLNPPH
ncbi:uncharacterized protein LOC126456371 [Schistocerca serialis cubense]|uniref:uncharacterized protein LOC126456371 n=1 Tax=Schistocerca serialis cubense TaxID=2023355 RepID=UPI00214E7A26|nr:uncharacterized protein LOC126456371 [Schistocerca serialis cubense]